MTAWMLGHYRNISAPSPRHHCFITAMTATPNYNANYSALPQATPEAQAHWKL